MARQYTRLSDIQYVPSTAGTIYANPASTKSYIKSLVLFNGNTTSETVNLHNVPNTTNGDSDISNVELLLHMDGTNGSTTFTDSSSNNLTMTVNNSAAITTSVKKFGTGSLNLTAAGNNYLSYPSASGDQLDVAQNQDLTVEFWAYVTAVESTNSVSSGTTMFEMSGDSGSRFSLHMITVSSTPTLTWSSNYGGASFNHQTGLTLNQWQHIALVRSSNIWNLYLDGVKSTSSNNDGAAITNSNFVIIGPRQNSTIKLYVDDFRYTVGVSRYTSTFTPPTSAFANDAIGDFVAGTANASNQFAQISVAAAGTSMFDLTYPITLIDTNDTIQASTTTANKVTVQILGDKDL